MSGPGGNPFGDIEKGYQQVGHAFESVAQGIGNVGKSIGKNPLMIIAAVALTVMTAGVGAAAAGA